VFSYTETFTVFFLHRVYSCSVSAALVCKGLDTSHHCSIFHRMPSLFPVAPMGPVARIGPVAPMGLNVLIIRDITPLVCLISSISATPCGLEVRKPQYLHFSHSLWTGGERASISRHRSRLRFFSALNVLFVILGPP
jgi:hypothetical protein